MSETQSEQVEARKYYRWERVRMSDGALSSVQVDATAEVLALQAELDQAREQVEEWKLEADRGKWPKEKAQEFFRLQAENKALREALLGIGKGPMTAVEAQAGAWCEHRKTADEALAAQPEAPHDTRFGIRSRNLAHEHRALCSCGWTGEWRQTKGAAEADAASHEAPQGQGEVEVLSTPHPMNRWGLPGTRRKS